MGALIVAGWDRIAGGQVYCVPVGGTVVQEAWAADGSGSTFLLGLMDSRYRYKLFEESHMPVWIWIEVMSWLQ